MRPSEAKVDLEARAFEMNPDGEALHTDLARANLLRLRGDYAEAEKLCVRVLEAQPESAAAHTLLGDISLAQNRADQAAEHYEIAQSLDPLAPDLARKLAEARAEQEARETETTAEQLGLPSRRPLPWQNSLLAVAGILVLSTGILLAVRAGHSTGVSRNVAAIVATPDTIANRPPVKAVSESAATGSGKAVAVPAPTEVGSAPAMTAGASTEDRGLWQVISQQSPMGSHLLSVVQDPRAKNILVTYFVAAGEDPRHVGADLAKAALQRAGDALGVTLRALREDQLIYMADVSRARYDETLTETWQHANAGEDAWIGFCLTNEWPFHSSEAADGTSASTPGTASGSAAGSGGKTP